MASSAAASSRQLIVDTQQALTSSRLAVATSRARLSHPAPVLQPPRPPSQPRPVVLDPWLELEAAIDRLARLVIHAQALADRTAALPAIVEAADRYRREDRLHLLRTAVDLGQCAITAATAGDARPRPADRLVSGIGQPPARSRVKQLDQPLSAVQAAVRGPGLESPAGVEQHPRARGSRCPTPTST